VSAWLLRGEEREKGKAVDGQKKFVKKENSSTLVVVLFRK